MAPAADRARRGWCRSVEPRRHESLQLAKCGQHPGPAFSCVPVTGFDVITERSMAETIGGRVQRPEPRLELRYSPGKAFAHDPSFDRLIWPLAPRGLGQEVRRPPVGEIPAPAQEVVEHLMPPA